MPVPMRYQSPSSSQLLQRVLEMPGLVRAVRELPAPVLVSLIDRVGLEDAGELVALASTEQLQQLLDEDLWLGDAGGEQERFSPRRFALWLAIIAEAGDEFVARTLSEMPIDLLTLGVQQLAWVLDMESLMQRLAGEQDGAERAERALQGASYEEWEEFALVARDLEAWDVLWDALLTLDRDHHERLRELLERCAWISQARMDDGDELGDLLSEEQWLECDVGEQREARRAERGYVSTSDARAFVRLALRGDDLRERDPITAAYFRRLQAVQVPQTPGNAESSRRGDADGAVAADRDEPRARPLLELLHEAGVVPPPSSAAGALGSGEPRAATEADLLEGMRQLAQTDPQRHAARVEELAYLANVLIALGGRGGALRPADALELAVALCELGLSHWPGAEPNPPAEAVSARWLEVSADRLFRQGLHTLRSEPDPAARLGRRCSAPLAATVVDWIERAATQDSGHDARARTSSRPGT